MMFLKLSQADGAGPTCFAGVNITVATPRRFLVGGLVIGDGAVSVGCLSYKTPKYAGFVEAMLGSCLK